MTTSIKLQRNLAFLAILLFIIKIIAWYWTKSVAVFTDAMESTVNVATGLIGWYSIWLAQKPKDKNHPYGHGKAEFISAAVEGTMIFVAGLIIIYEAATNLAKPKPLQRLDWGLALLALTALINFIVGKYAISHGKKVKSATLEAGGRHLCTDTYSTVGIIIGLILMMITDWAWLDATVAMIFAVIILVTGYRVLRKSLAGIMDEADLALLEELISYLQTNRKPEWTDLHNLRMIQYGSTLHLDGHLTLPWYFTVKEAHHEIESLDHLIRNKFGDAIELFVHVDGCESFSCKICQLENCPVRQHPFEQIIVWNPENVLQNRKHQIE
ncbi:cation transporter [Taibaiella lutea]|uniref:Cation transporter n=1 Tax=Taibaiella lutea TaxID=2608001 RepID=A0A5M6CNP7_9BACT|nr:cation diffusion facilitator family transporter [Taibaiella lutea]KAA5536636.1 cation transporter [Taibaiella lutea]